MKEEWQENVEVETLQIMKLFLPLMF